MVEFDQNLQLRQRQEQTLTPAQLASLNILAAPLELLEQRIHAELEQNPLLEAAPPPREELIGEPLGDAGAADNAPDEPRYDGDEEDFSRLSELADHWGDQVAEAASGAPAPDLQERHDYQLASLTRPGTLTDFLTEQLDFADPAPPVSKAAELIIGSIDERGFLATPPADIAMAGELAPETVDKALKLVQSFDPPGVGARNVAESLTIQLKRKHYADPAVYRLLAEHLDDIEHNRLPQAARALGIDLDHLYRLLDDLKHLNPSPAGGFASGAPEVFIAPEMALEFHNGELVITGRDRYIPHLHLVKRYLDLLDDPATPPETKAYLKEKLAQAETLLKGIALRQDTLTRITEYIARRQKAYFEHGIEALTPMTMAETADALGVHETTVSRAVADKYLATPQGLKEYRFFFSSGFRNADGEDVSSRSIKESIRRMIAEEDPRKPLSDAAIAERLAQQGLAMARRTVAKYRESMNIPATSLRRRH